MRSLLAGLAVAAAGSLAVAPGAGATTVQFTDTSQLTMFTVPTGVTSVSFLVEGAAGRPGGGGVAGGTGAVLTGDLAVTPGQQLWIKVGGLDQGGAGYNAFDAATDSVGGNGGGASDIRTVETDLASRVLVAGGGGGGGGSGQGTGTEGAGGAGGDGDAGGTTGANASSTTGGGGGGAGGSASGGAAGAAGSLFGSPGAGGTLPDGGAGGERGFSGGGAGGGGGGGGDGLYGGGGGGGGGSACCPDRTAGGGGGGGGSNYAGGGVSNLFEGLGDGGDGFVSLTWTDPGEFLATPASKDFGSTAPGSATDFQSFEIKNDNAGEDDPGDLQISAVALTGADAGQFEIGSDGCEGATLAADETCTVTARFSPTSAGTKAASLSFTHDGVAGDPSPTELALTGTASSPAPPPQASDFSFGKVRRKKQKGIAFQTVNLPGPGQVGLSGPGVATVAGAQAAQQVGSAGPVELKVKPVGKAAKKLRRKGKLAVTITVTFTPTGGSPTQKSTGLVLKRTSGGQAGQK